MEPLPEFDKLIHAWKGGGESRFWREVVDAMHDSLVIVSPDKELLFMNAAARDLCGVDQEAIRGRSCLDVIQCPNCACECRLFREGKVDNLTVAVYDGDGVKRQMLKNASVLRDPRGRVIGGIETMKDITDEVSERRQKEAQVESLFQEKKRTEALLRNLPVGVLTLDGQLTILSCSPQVEEITGYSSRDLIGSNFRTSFQLDEDPEFPDSGAELADMKRQLLLRERSGAARRVEVRFEHCRYREGEILGIMRDLDGGTPAGEGREEFHDFHGMVTVSNRMMEVFRLLEKAAETDASVLLYGETGTGKELLARALHRLSNRRNGPFKALNCATLRGELLLSSLFGHEKGAFTGAVARKEGKLAAAGQGTLFLDELHEIPIEHQSVLLRVLDEKSFERVGGNQSIPLNARVVCATNTDLADAVADGRFRQDLFYRINVFPIAVPPLRQRKEDVELLVRYFLARKARRLGEPGRRVTPEVLQALGQHDWPGNIRELKNVAEYLHFVSDDEIRVRHLPGALADLATGDRRRSRGQPATSSAPDPDAGRNDERAQLLAALELARFNKTVAAEALGINRTTLWRRMKRLGIDG
jgi:PAS domain S-box-containing protein